MSDTSPIRALDHLGHLDLLRELYAEVLVPPAVSQELVHPSSGLVSIDLFTRSFIKVQAPLDLARVAQFLKNLDRGESEAIALALEVQAQVILIDEFRGREEARKLGLIPVGVLGTLLRAKDKGHILEIAPLIDRLRDELNFFLSSQLVAQVLFQAGE